MYTLVFDEEAITFLNKLPKHVSKRIFNKIQETKENPRRYFERLTNHSAYKLRVGDYRVIADINDSEITIYIILVGHRKNVYKKL